MDIKHVLSFVPSGTFLLSIRLLNTPQRVKRDEQSGDKSRTFIFNDESHTLGNCLVSIINTYDDVKFCGYTVPHPAEQKMHLRIQTRGPRAIDVLERACKDLEKLCDTTTNKFKAAVQEYTDKDLTNIE